MLPKAAIIAVTLNCNSKCIMCNIWKNRLSDELKPEDYLKLPPSLCEINITGGEPFLRNDLERIIENIKCACKNARIVISTNGYLFNKIEAKMKEIQYIDPKVALRISLDGLEETHDKIRGLKGCFKNALESLWRAKRLGVRDLGISMTVSSINVKQIYDIFMLSKKLGVQFTITYTSDSDIYFGNVDESIKLFNFSDFNQQVSIIINERIRTLKPKEWARAWFESLLLYFIKNKKRPFPCDSAKGFFYMDSVGNVYGCHILNNYIDNLRARNSFEDLWRVEKRHKIYEYARKCTKCWMVCTAKSEINNQKGIVALEILKMKFKSWK